MKTLRKSTSVTQRLFKILASFKMHQCQFSSAYMAQQFLTYLMNLAARVSVTHITCDTEICSACPWQEHPSTRNRLGTAEPKYGMRCRWTQEMCAICRFSAPFKPAYAEFGVSVEILLIKRERTKERKRERKKKERKKERNNDLAPLQAGYSLI